MSDGSRSGREAAVAAATGRYLFAAVLLAAPWPYGANRPLAWSLLALALAVAILGAAIAGGLRGERLRPPAVVLGGFLALVMERIGPGPGEGDRRSLLRAFLDGLFGRRWYLPALLVLLGTAVLLTGSRGGFVSLLLATVFLLFMVHLATRPGRGPALATAGLLLTVGWILIALGGDPVLERLLETEELDTGRLQIYGLALEMIGDRPWLGHGYGGFEPVFMLYRDPRFSLVFDRAHDTYLEHAVGLGLPASLLLYAAMAALFLHLTRGIFRRRRNRVFPLLASAATVLVGLHALVDFSIQIPAVAVTYAAILGLGLARAVPRDAPAPPPTARRSR